MNSKILLVVVAALVGQADWCKAQLNEGNAISNSEPREISDFLTILGPSNILKDHNGNVTKLKLPPDSANDAVLAVVSKINSIQEVAIQSALGAEMITKTGIESLRRLPNLVALQIGCGSHMNSEVMKEICNLTALKTLKLDLACPPKEEFLCLTNLQKLEYLRITHCEKFGDVELSNLTNLVRLKCLVLNSVGVSNNGTNVLRDMPSLTNVSVRVREMLVK